MNSRSRLFEWSLQALELPLKGALVVVFLMLVYVGTNSYFPCLRYPTAVSKMEGFGFKVEAFRARHGYLPDDSVASHVVELDLEAGYRFDYWPEHSRYYLRVAPGVDPDDLREALRPFKLSLDGPWVMYDASTQSIQCGHR